MTAPAALYRLIEKESRVYAVDARDIEICGARQPYGHTSWTFYPTVRLPGDLHQMMAPSKEAAIAHVRMVAELYVRAVA